jgi:beta-aspartyl-dipeptidase (metallo-type)
MTFDPSFLVVKGADLRAPEALGPMDLVLGGGRILGLGPNLSLPATLRKTIDARGLLAVPGFIDGHVHLLGGGGEGGFASRTPELTFGEAARAGITTVVGCLGTDGITRSLESLLAKARGLEAEGISAFILSGSYGIPPLTLTGSVERDLLLIDKVIGTGEVALSDHRSSQPTFEEFLRVVANSRRGGMLSGKAGVVTVHLGDGSRGMEMLRRMLAETEIPPTQVWPTHVNRNPELFAEAAAFAKCGGVVDITTSGVARFYETGTVEPAAALRRLLESGVEPGRITFTSDGQGSLPVFEPDGSLSGLAVGGVGSLAQSFRDAVLEEGVPLEHALRVVTTNPAMILRLSDRGRIAAGQRADLLLLHPETLAIHTVVSGGRVLVEDGMQRVFGAFEQDGAR